MSTIDDTIVTKFEEGMIGKMFEDWSQRVLAQKHENNNQREQLLNAVNYSSAPLSNSLNALKIIKELEYQQALHATNPITFKIPTDKITFKIPIDKDNEIVVNSLYSEGIEEDEDLPYNPINTLTLAGIDWGTEYPIGVTLNETIQGNPVNLYGETEVAKLKKELEEAKNELKALKESNQLDTINDRKIVFEL